MKIRAWYARSEFGNVRDKWAITPPAITVSEWEEYEIELPEGYTLDECNGGTMEIYDANGKHCQLINGPDGEPRPKLYRDGERVADAYLIGKRA